MPCLRRFRARGFTLVELMVVVAIVGILAAIGGYGLSRYIASSKTGEAVQMIGTIKAAQESYKDETFSYLSVAPDVTSNSSYYPHDFSAALPGRAKVQWGGGTSAVANAWRVLGVNPSGPVLFAYACTADGPGAVKSVGSDIPVGNWPSQLGEPWYIVKARADLQSGGDYTVFVGTSFTTQLFSAHEGD